MRQDFHSKRERDHDRIVVSINPHMEIIIKQRLESTNRYCELLDLPQIKEFTIIQALEQTHGIGQQGNHWESEPGKNLTFSLILKPSIDVADQFEITKVLSLGITDAIRKLLNNSEPVIKWPNDIYIKEKKIGGILVSNKIRSNQIAASICGIGLNVNQTQFADWIPNPTSLSLQTGQTHPLQDVLQEILESIKQRYIQQQEGNDLEKEYLGRLLYFRQRSRYLYHNEYLEGTITGVNRFGHLQLETIDGRTISCQMKEIAFCGL